MSIAYFSIIYLSLHGVSNYLCVMWAVTVSRKTNTCLHECKFIYQSEPTTTEEPQGKPFHLNGTSVYGPMKAIEMKYDTWSLFG
jgi:hypothetical protein